MHAVKCWRERTVDVDRSTGRDGTIVERVKRDVTDVTQRLLRTCSTPTC